MTPQHKKGCGSLFKSRGLAWKVLLGRIPVQNTGACLYTIFLHTKQRYGSKLKCQTVYTVSSWHFNFEVQNDAQSVNTAHHQEGLLQVVLCALCHIERSVPWFEVQPH